MQYQLDQVPETLAGSAKQNHKSTPSTELNSTLSPKPSPELSSELSPEINALIQAKNRTSLGQPVDSLSRIGGSLAVHCLADLENRRIVEAASMATLYKGYESLLPGRDIKQVGLVSSTASGICGGVHATASALCLEMALGLKPPAFGIVLRNLLLSCQYLNDNTMHLFVLAGPDYSQATFEHSNPEIWHKAQQSACKQQTIHGYHRIGDIMTDLNKGVGKLYKEALKMVSLARKAYILLGGKYPHSESIIPGGVSITVDADKLEAFKTTLDPFAAYSQKTAAIWDEIFDFLLTANPRYQELGRSPASMLDFGQWDHPEHYDASYQHCDSWGKKRWSTPAVVIDGKLACDQLSLLNAGMEESLDYSYQTLADASPGQLIQQDPLGNAISAHHPWNKRSEKPRTMKPGSLKPGSIKPRSMKPRPIKPNAYSWGSSLTWRGHGFEVGAYSRLYLTALAQNLPSSQYLAATGKSLDFLLPMKNALDAKLIWQVPAIWNAFERNRARAYALAFNLSVTLENIDTAMKLVQEGETQTHVQLTSSKTGQQLGVGLWGASRGFLAHWAVIKDQAIDNYQISVPSRVNAGTRTSSNAPGPLEKALMNTPIIESRFKNAADFSAIDIQRTIQSFDPCMSCSAHVLIKDTGEVLDKEIDTSFPI
ncbi:MAG: nickel-dependent hydrogenase large subunit [Gammaproteobacteria bacterium]|nr:nickel-dependent hydrogenase large subunit [Gammaproteobacteria bacterium]